MRAIPVLLAVALCFVLASERDARAQLDEHPVCGDADGDDRVSVTDGVLALRAAAGLSSSCALETCDADRDGAFGVTDGVLVLRAATEITTIYCRAPINAWVRALRGVFADNGEFPLRRGLLPPPTGAPRAITGVHTTGTVAPGHRHAVEIPFDFHDAPENTTGALLVAVETPNGSLASGFFEIPFLMVDHRGAFCVALDMARMLSTEAFSLMIATRVGDEVSPYERVPLTVKAQPTLSFVEAHSEGPGYDRTALKVSPDGRHVYVVQRGASALHDGGVLIFERDSREGTIRLVGELGDLGAVSAITLSPDGSYVYLSMLEGSIDLGGVIVVSRRDPATGMLEVAQRLRNGDGGTKGLAASGDLVLSPDGDYLYASASRHRDVIAPDLLVFRRDATAGTLQFVEAKGVEAGTSRASAQWLGTSPNGSFVYLTGTREIDSGDGAPPFLVTLATYARHPANGSLTLVDERVIYRYESPVPYLGDVADLLVGADGAVFVATETRDGGFGEEEPQLLRFVPDSQTHALVLADVVLDDTTCRGGLQQPRALGQTYDGSRVFLLDGGAYRGATLQVRDRDRITGDLRFRDAQVEGVDGVTGLRGGQDLAVSPDGAFVYVTGVDPTLLHGSVAVFALH